MRYRHSFSAFIVVALMSTTSLYGSDKSEYDSSSDEAYNVRAAVSAASADPSDDKTNNDRTTSKSTLMPGKSSTNQASDLKGIESGHDNCEDEDSTDYIDHGKKFEQMLGEFAKQPCLINFDPTIQDHEHFILLPRRCFYPPYY